MFAGPVLLAFDSNTGCCWWELRLRFFPRLHKLPECSCSAAAAHAGAALSESLQSSRHFLIPRLYYEMLSTIVGCEACLAAYYSVFDADSGRLSRWLYSRPALNGPRERLEIEAPPPLAAVMRLFASRILIIINFLIWESLLNINFSNRSKKQWYRKTPSSQLSSFLDAQGGGGRKWSGVGTVPKTKHVLCNSKKRWRLRRESPPAG